MKGQLEGRCNPKMEALPLCARQDKYAPGIPVYCCRRLSPNARPLLHCIVSPTASIAVCSRLRQLKYAFQPTGWDTPPAPRSRPAFKASTASRAPLSPSGASLDVEILSQAAISQHDQTTPQEPPGDMWAHAVGVSSVGAGRRGPVL
ncbi:hypothetical protein NDU88_006080 [Pleurodeles waltl]|uniref:Uncharacterized protein n=1 Tax=Pleurodeles waltl TaxID=8319 RepID=A0AAV7TVS3_PLEWA|nr:hypothetical protein NDU88_006080 [Pleurodeles waltl]